MGKKICSHKFKTVSGAKIIEIKIRRVLKLLEQIINPHQNYQGKKVNKKSTISKTEE